MLAAMLLAALALGAALVPAEALYGACSDASNSRWSASEAKPMLLAVNAASRIASRGRRLNEVVCMLVSDLWSLLLCQISLCST